MKKTTKRGAITVATLALAALTVATQADAAKQKRKAKKQTTTAAVATPQQSDSLLLFNTGEKDGMRMAIKRRGNNDYTDLGQAFSSDYGRWGSEKRMFTPTVTRLNDGAYVALFSVNDHAPCFAVAYSDDLVFWRPQDYPRMSVKGCLQPVVRDEGQQATIFFKTKEGQVRKTTATDHFRHFTADTPATEAEYEAAAQATAQANVAGKQRQGFKFAVDSATAQRVTAYFAKAADDNRKAAETLKNDGDMAKQLGGKAQATITLDGRRTKKISDKVIGIFFEDISYAADGGLYAEMVQNRDFEYSQRDRNGWTATTAWHSSKGDITIGTEQPLSEVNAHYATIADETITNDGWDGMALDKGENYDFSFYVRNTTGKAKTFKVELKDGDNVLAETTIKTKGNKGQWTQYSATMTPTAAASKATLALTGTKQTQANVDMISLFPHNTFCNRKNGLRRDLAQTLADLKPRFVRFPGGCMSHGDGLDNIYHWQLTVGPLHQRTPERNSWGYHQTRGLGFYELFQFCEDIGAEPLPVLAAGVPCQNSGNDKDGYGGQQGGIPMSDMPAYIDELCNMIEWANGDPNTSKWAKMRADAGHPAPFNLKYIGIGNEDIISTVFEERCLMICQEIKKRYPNITICGTVGPFHAPSSDYIEGWRFANKHKDVIDMVDEHYYESVGWLLNNQHYYDNYDRKGPKVYLGEWAAKVGKGGLDCALAEAAYLCGVERNADVVEMTSYAPLLSKNGHSNWSPDMIYFGNNNIEKTPSYETQRLFAEHAGDTYIATSIEGVDSTMAHRVAASTVRDSKTGKTYLKVANILPAQLNITLALKDINMSGAQLKWQGFSGKPGDKTVKTGNGTYDIRQDDKLTISLPPYSFQVIEL